MLTLLLVLVVFGGVIYYINHKMQQVPAPLLKATKKVESVVIDVADVNDDGKVDVADAVAAVKKVKKVAKKVTGTKKKTK